jgi:hypothetical protein
MQFVLPAPLVPPPFPVPPPPQVPTGNQNALDAIAGDIRVLRDATECQQLCEVTFEENKKDSSCGWDKIPEIV